MSLAGDKGLGSVDTSQLADTLQYGTPLTLLTSPETLWVFITPGFFDG